MESAVTGGISEKAMLDREKTEFYFEQVSFEVSMRHPSRDIKKKVVK